MVSLTTMEKVKNWFGMAGTTTATWITENFNKIIAGMLSVATTALIGLTIYFAYDYKNYQKLLAKLAEYNKGNLMERANVALKPEISEGNEEQNIEQIQTVENLEIPEKVQEVNEGETEKVKLKIGRGRRFK